MRIMRSELSWYKRSETIRPISVLVHVTCDLLAGHTFAYILGQIHACRHNTSREHRPWCTSRAPLVLGQHSSWGQTGADKQEEVRSESQQINHLQKSCDPPMGYRLHHMDLYNTKKVLDKKSAGGSHKILVEKWTVCFPLTTCFQSWLCWIVWDHTVPQFDTESTCFTSNRQNAGATGMTHLTSHWLRLNLLSCLRAILYIGYRL